MKPRFLPPPAVSVVVSVVTPLSPAVVPSATRPVEAKNSACFCLGCRIACARPVSGTMPPAPPLSVYSTPSTVKVLASAPWPEVRPDLKVPSQPVWWLRPWACSSWPSETVTLTSLQEMPAPVVPSSGSVTVIL